MAKEREFNPVKIGRKNYNKLVENKKKTGISIQKQANDAVAEYLKRK